MGTEVNKIILFRNKKIRRQLHGGEWWFAVVDVIAVLTDSPEPRKYWSVLKTRLKKEGSELTTNCSQLKMVAADGKKYLTDVADIEQILRLVQSVPSKNAEPFKRWLARVGYERVQEIENPELAQKRMKILYKLKGYSDAWIERRVRGIAIRDELTDEWQKRGVKEEREYAILTAEISKATFGVTPSEYKKLKGLKRENLRDHMNDLELLFTQLGEAATAEIARTDDSQGFSENTDAARRGGAVAGKARADLEEQTRRKVVSPENYKDPQVLEG